MHDRRNPTKNKNVQPLNINIDGNKTRDGKKTDITGRLHQRKPSLNRQYLPPLRHYLIKILIFKATFYIYPN